MSWMYKIPQDTAITVGRQSIDNFALEFYRFCRWRYNRKKAVEEPEKKPKSRFPEAMLEIQKNLCERHKECVELLQKAGYECKKITASPQWRMVIGLGGEHPQETSMTLHHIYGIPYIPGSAIKGITRHWAESKNDPDFVEVFGDESQEGNVIFMDAFPKDNIELEVDIMNPHYPDYYTKQKPPTDYQNPNPIFFLTVGKNTKFTFYLLSKNRKLLDKTISWLKSALLEQGIGAKTAVGYGIFNVGEV
jgi:CRISPR-associated protein Cmr6